MNPNVLKALLDECQENYHRREFLSSDPLEFVHLYKEPLDQEAVGLIAALLAYGNVKQIRRSVTDALKRIDSIAPSPATLVKSLGEPHADKRLRKAFEGFFHRFNRGSDIVLLLRLLSQSWSRYGSLGSHLVHYLKPEHEDFGEALGELIEDWKKWSGKKGKAGYFSFLLTSPKDGSCCKRWCMYLRWMGRRDDLDPGLWTEKGALAKTFPQGRSLSSRQLVVPLDTHLARIGRRLGLTRRKSTDWKAAVEVTRSLRVCDPADPVRYDFSLCRLGIVDKYKKEYKKLEVAL